MSLRKFLEYRVKRPLCNNPLSLFLSSKKQQKHIYEKNSLIIKFPMYNTNHSHYYDVAYSFNLDSNSFWIDFYTKDNIKMEESLPIFLFKKFKGLDANIKIYKFYNVCEKCDRYNYCSNNFSLNLTQGKIDCDIILSSEYLGLSQKSGEYYKLFRIINSFNVSNSIIEYGRGKSFESLLMNGAWIDCSDITYTMLKLPLINFSTEEEIINRLNKLILFS